MGVNDVEHFDSLSPAWRKLIRRIQATNFGWVMGLIARNGELIPGPQFRVVSEVKLSGQNGPRSETSLDDFALKAEVRELREEAHRLKDGVAVSIQVKHGLPFLMRAEDPIGT